MVFFMEKKKSKLGSAIQMYYFGSATSLSFESESAQDKFHYCLHPHFQCYCLEAVYTG